MAHEKGLISFGTFEKQAPGLRKNPASSSNAQNGSAAWVTLTARLPLSTVVQILDSQIAMEKRTSQDDLVSVTGARFAACWYLIHSIGMIDRHYCDWLNATI